MLTVAAFLLGFLFAFPEGGITDWVNFAVTGVFLGLTTTGVYDVIKSAAGK
jgi:fluoride ion exporter CrcB/FEX